LWYFSQTDRDISLNFHLREKDPTIRTMMKQEVLFPHRQHTAAQYLQETIGDLKGIIWIFPKKTVILHPLLVTADQKTKVP